MKNNYDVIVIGAGPAGLAAAIEAEKTGAKDVLILERNDEPGGILPQCIHNGFGSVIFKADLPGPYYASEFIRQAREAGVKILLDTMVLEIDENLLVTATNSSGFLELNAGAVVLAMGCRERTRPQIHVPGDRPAGIFTAGMVQRMVNIEGFMPGKNFIILGSGDIGMIMARRLTLEGAKVIKVMELLPRLTGLRRNYVQCLQDFSIPLELSTTIKRINGINRVESVDTVKVDASLSEIPGTEENVECDSVMLSVGLIPENELSKKAGVMLDPLTGGPVVDENMATNVPGIYAAGNAVTIYDLVDYVTKAGMLAGRSAALFSQKNIIPPLIKEDTEGFMRPEKEYIKLVPGENVRSVVPQKISRNISGNEPVLVELRVTKDFESRTVVSVSDGEGELYSKTEKYARPAEMITLKISPEKLRTNSKKLTVNAEAVS